MRAPSWASTPRRLQASIDVEAPARIVWEVLIDFGSFPEWNPFVRRAAGRLAPGERLALKLKIGRRLVSVRPRVTRVDAPDELRWRVHPGVPGVFDVEFVFRVEERGARSTLHQSGTCTGVLTPLLFARGRLEPHILRGYVALGCAVKVRAEREAALKSDLTASAGNAA